MIFGQIARLSIWTIIGNVVSWLSFTIEAWLKVQYSGLVRVVQRQSDTLEDLITDNAPDRIAVWIEDINLERLMITLVVIIIIATFWYGLKKAWRQINPKKPEPSMI